MLFQLVDGVISEHRLVLSLGDFGFDKIAMAMICVAGNPLMTLDYWGWELNF